MESVKRIMKRAKTRFAWRTASLAAVICLLSAGMVVAADQDKSIAFHSTKFGSDRLLVHPDGLTSPPSLEITLQDDQSRVVYRFPAFRNTGELAVLNADSIALDDVNHDGQLDLLVVAEAMTGIGPSGAEPFKVAGIYLQTADGFARDIALEDELNSPSGSSKWQTIDELRMLVRKDFP